MFLAAVPQRSGTPDVAAGPLAFKTSAPGDIIFE
jgi:hypothetical protein